MKHLLAILASAMVALCFLVPPLFHYLVLPLALVIPIIFLITRPQPKKIFKESPYLSQTDSQIAQYSNGPFWSSDKKICRPIRVSLEGAGSMNAFAPTTFCKLMAKAASKRPNKPALRVERPTPPLVDRHGVPLPIPLVLWKKWTWKQYYDETRLVARAFITLGLEPFDAVSIFGFNSPEWLMAELGCIFAGGIAAGIYPSDTPDQVSYKAKHSGTVIAVVESNKKADVFLQAVQKGELPKLRAIVVWGQPSSSDNLTNQVPENITVCNWTDLSRHASVTSENTLKIRMDEQQPGNVCCYIYTSGTTGKPKSVMLTHDNLLWEGSAIHYIWADQKVPIGDKEEEDRILSYLPLSHVAGMLVDIVNPLYCTAMRQGWMSTNFARPYDLKVGSLADRLKTVRPTLFLGVPRVWEKIMEKMVSLGLSIQGVKKKVASFAKEQGIKHANACQMGGSGEYPILYPLANMAILSKIKLKLGLDKCKYGLSGAAPIQKDTLEYFAALGVQINEAYGMSENCGAVTMTTPSAHLWGSCGWALPGCEVKIFRCSDNDMNEKKECPRAKNLFKPSEEEQGEVCFRGRNIMAGYMANPDLGPEHEEAIKKKNAGAIDNDGWLHSGDKGCIDARGLLKLTGRYKELIIGAGGENVAPVPIENHIKKLCPAISNVMMVGDHRKYNICFITLKAVGATGEKPGGDELDSICHDISPEVKTISKAMKDMTWIATITRAIDTTNKNGDVCPSNASKIQKFSILPSDFSVETSELTATLKLKRSVVQKMHNELVERMYEGGREKYIPFYLS